MCSVDGFIQIYYIYNKKMANYLTTNHSEFKCKYIYNLKTL